jgi:hypothetical protein
MTECTHPEGGRYCMRCGMRRDSPSSAWRGLTSDERDVNAKIWQAIDINKLGNLRVGHYEIVFSASGLRGSIMFDVEEDT